MSGWGWGPAAGGGPFLPTGGGTMTGGITLANVAATLTGGGSTATWTPSALSHTYTIQQASGSTGVTWNYTNSYASGNLFIINDNTGSAARSVLTLTALAAGQPNLQWSRSGTVEGSISIGTTYGFEIGIVSGGGNRNITRLYGGTSTTANGGGIRIDAGNGAGASGAGGAVVEITGNGGGSGAGGNWSATCGTGGATGVGGNATITSGIGGSTSGACGDVSLVGANAGTGSGNGGGINLTSGNGSSTGTGSRGGAIAILTGNGNGSIARQSGAFTITTGTPSSAGTSGAISLTTGVGGSVSGASGDITFQTGTTTSGTTGNISLVVGTPTAGTTGDIAFTGARNLTLTGGGTPVMTLINDDAGAGGGPDITLYRNSASAAANDVMGRIIFDGNSATPTRRTMGMFQSVLVTATDGAEDAKLEFYTIAGGASNLAVWFAETGQIHADLGAGTGNVTVFDEHDDVGLIRRLYNQEPDRERRERAWASLEPLGLMSRKPDGSGWSIAIQPWLALLAGGIYQTADRVSALESENSMLRARVTALEARCQ